MQKLNFFIVPEKVTSLLGINACQDLGLVSFTEKVHRCSPSQETTEQILAQYKELFDNKLGKLLLKYSIVTDPDIMPIVRAPHRLSHAMCEHVQNKLQRMESLGIIAAVNEPSNWVSTMVVATKKNKDEIGICINPRDLNTVIMCPHYPM